MSGSDIHLGPDDLLGRSFTIGLRGYDQVEVDSFLEQASEAWRASLSAAPGSDLSSSAIAALADAGHDASPPIDAASEPVVSSGASDDVLPVPETAAASDDGAQHRAPDPALHSRWRTEAELDRTAAFAARKAAELDRATARTEVAQAHESALEIIDQAQRRADAVLTKVRERAQAEAGSLVEDARSRLLPLLETERATRSRLARLQSELQDVAEETIELVLPDADQLVTDAEDDPEAPEVSFPVGFGLVSVGGPEGVT